MDGELLLILVATCAFVCVSNGIVFFILDICTSNERITFGLVLCNYFKMLFYSLCVATLLIVIILIFYGLLLCIGGGSLEWVIDGYPSPDTGFNP